MTLTTYGQSKITAKEVVAARKLKVAYPELSMQAIKDQLKLKLSTIMVGRAIRGISHGHIDMCGLQVRPMVHRGEAAQVVPAVAPAKRATKKATVKTAAKKAVPAAAA